MTRSSRHRLESRLIDHDWAGVPCEWEAEVCDPTKLFKPEEVEQITRFDMGVADGRMLADVDFEAALRRKEKA